MDGEALQRFKRARFWHVLVLSWLAYCCYTMVRRPFSVARAEIEKELNVSAATLSWVDTTFVVTYSFAQFVYGSLKKRLGYTRILLAGFTCSIMSCVILTYSSSVVVFALVWGMNGLAQGTGWASCMELLSAWVFPAERGRVMGAWSTNMAAGGVLGNVVPAYLMGRGHTWRTATLIEVVCGPCVVLVVAVLQLKSNPNMVGLPSVKQAEQGVTAEQLRETPKIGVTKDGEFIFSGSMQPGTAELVDPAARDEKHDAPPQRQRQQERVEVSLSPLQILRMPGALGYSLSYFLHKLVRYAFMFWLPYYLSKELHATSELSGYVASAFDVGGVVGIVASGYVSDCFDGGRRRVLVLLGFTVGMATATFILGAFSDAFGENMWLCAALVFSVGLFSFAVDALQSGPCLLGFCDALGAPVGAMSGVVGGVGSLGSALQGVFTVMLSSSSWGTLFFSFSSATVVAGLLMARPLAMERRANNSIKR